MFQKYHPDRLSIKVKILLSADHRLESVAGPDSGIVRHALASGSHLLQRQAIPGHGGSAEPQALGRAANGTVGPVSA